ncbi:MAG: hypothetical protein ACHQD9_00470 [Chitinophagales bacterium]
MHLLLDIEKPEDKKLISELTRRLRIKTAEVSLDDIEDFAFGKLIEEGMKSKSVDKEQFMKRLRKRIES